MIDQKYDMALLVSSDSKKEYNIRMSVDMGDKTSANVAEAWAVGTKNGQPVSEDAPQHENSSKDWAQKAKKYVEDAGDAEAAKKAAVAAQKAAEEAANSLKSAGAEATTLAAGSAATAVIQDVNGAKKFLFGIPKGDPFVVRKTFASVAEMTAYKGTDVKVNDFVLIASTVEDEDNAKLYVKASSGYVFLTDLSGAQGIKGDTGVTPNISIGNVTTLAAGSSVTVTIRGTAENPILDIGIPRGNTGSTGATPSFTIGTVQTLAEGSKATATITGTAKNPVLNLGIPKGDTGSAENVRGDNIPISGTDNTTVKQRIDKLDVGLYVDENGYLCQTTD